MATPRLLILTNVFPPDAAGGASLFGDLAFELARRGMSVTVRTAMPYYPQWTDKSGRNGLRVWRYRERGVQVERYGLFIPRNPNTLIARLLYEASFTASLLRPRLSGGRFDAVMAFVPMMGCLVAGAAHRLLHRAPLWLNVQDLPADAAASSDITRSRLVGRLLAGVQRLLFNRADVWSSIAPIMIERLEALRRGGQPIHYLPNWLHASLAEHLAAQPDKLGRPPGQPLRLFYSGNVGQKQGLLAFCEQLAQTPAAFDFRINAGGGQAPALARWVEQRGDRRFHVHGFVEEAQLARQLHEADLFVITEKRGNRGSFIPSKLIPALAAATPVLAVCDGQSPLGVELADSGAGLRLSWDALPELPRRLEALASDAAAYGQLQRAAAARAAFYDRTRVIDAYERLLRQRMRREG